MGKKIASQPIIFNLNKAGDRRRFNSLRVKRDIKVLVDDYVEQLKELFAVNNPTWVYAPGFEDKFRAYLRELKRQGDLAHHGRWVYYPWLFNAVHLLPDRDFQRVRMARNRNLINEQEQQKFYNSVIGIGGLSVGNSVIMSIVLQGGGKHIKLADFDRLALSNLNRIRAGVQFLGLPKVEMAARQIYELNPYAKVELFPEGLTSKNLDKFFKSPKLDIMIDELDNIAVKFLVRKKAKQYRVPVVMGADDGDNAVVDIERYDLKRNLSYFHNRLGPVTYNSLSNLDKFGIGRTITQHIGPENITERMQNSLLEMGKTIVSWPQLGGAALLNGSAVAYCVRRILNGQTLEGNRSIISLDDKLIPEYNTKREITKRNRLTKGFKKLMHLE